MDNPDLSGAPDSGMMLCDPTLVGTVGCQCLAGDACNPGLVCKTGVCMTIDPGSEGGACKSDGTCNAGLACVSSVCTACTGAAGCLCGTGDTCDTGLACDKTKTPAVCAPPPTCATVCADHQRCTQASGAAPNCLPECEPGFNYANNSCTAIAGANCTPGSATGISESCATLNRACSAGPPASCGTCYAGFILSDDGYSCRAVNTCSSLGCASANRLCTPEATHTDAVCGDCLPGYMLSAGSCVPAGLQCDSGNPNGVEAQCAALNRSCVNGGSGATCGPCNAGYVNNADTGLCDAAVACSALNCANLFRNCSDTPNGHCTDCLAGFKTDVATGLCRMPITCAALTCNSTTEVCVEGAPGEDARCQVKGQCLSNQVPLANGGCAACACDTNADPGLTGDHWPEPSPEDRCICKTKPNYFYTNAGSVLCDADGDGWIANSARPFMEYSTTDPRRKSASCGALRADGLRYTPTVDRVVLENDAGETTTVLIGSVLPLYEADRNDRQILLDQAVTDGTVSKYGTSGRNPQAAELNGFTKACVSLLADYNANGLDDVSEYQGNTAQTGENKVRQDFSYFMELHRGWYEAPTMGTIGIYHVREKARKAGGSAGPDVVPMCYSDGATCGTSSKGTYWQDCTRKTDTSYTAGMPAMTMDFARVAPAAGWRGMLHHSEFKCVQVVNTAVNRVAEPQKFTAAELNPAGEEYNSFNTCQSTNPTPSGPVLPGTANPVDPVFNCTPVQNPVPGVGWMIAGLERYTGGGKPVNAYKWGCVDECGETAATCPFCTQTKQSCPLYGQPAGTCQADTNNFGKLICTCTTDPSQTCNTGLQGVCQPGHQICPSPSSTSTICAQDVQPSAEICDGLDNNCNGPADDGFNLATDGNNCGLCGRVCQSAAHVGTTTCSGGNCNITSCASGWENPDGQWGTGCECQDDSYEAVGGDTCPAAIIDNSAFSTMNESGVVVPAKTITGNINKAGDEDWYQITFNDAADISGQCDTFRPTISFAAGTNANYRFKVRNANASCTQLGFGNSNCTTDVKLTSFVYNPGPSGNHCCWSDTNDTSRTSQCANQSFTLRVGVVLADGASPPSDCSGYTLQIKNGP